MKESDIHLKTKRTLEYQITICLSHSSLVFNKSNTAIQESHFGCALYRNVHSWFNICALVLPLTGSSQDITTSKGDQQDSDESDEEEDDNKPKEEEADEEPSSFIMGGN